MRSQKERDKAIDHLVEVMNDVYSFVQEAEPLKNIISHKQIVAVISQQTIECAYFIRDYSINENFCVSLFVFGLPKSSRSVYYSRETNCSEFHVRY